MKETNDIKIIKKEIAERLSITLEELDERIKRIQEESHGLISEKIAMLILLERAGIVDPELINKLTSEHAILKISDIAPKMYGINIVGRIVRVIPIKKKDEHLLVVDDGSGRALVLLKGRQAEICKKLKLEDGDAILIRNARALEFTGRFKRIIVSDDSQISYLDETDLLMYPVGILPPLPRIMTVSEIIKLSEELINEDFEIDVRGVLVGKSNINEIKRENGRTVRKQIIYLADEADLRRKIRVILWDKIIDLVSENASLGDIVILQGGILRKNEYFARKGEDPLELHFGNLSAIKNIGVRRDKIRDLRIGNRNIIFGYVLSPPRIKTYIDKRGTERKYAWFLVGDETGIARIIIWREEIINSISNLRIRTPVRINAIARESAYGRFVELHISTLNDEIIISPKVFPQDLSWEAVRDKARREGIYKEKTPKDKTIIDTFEKIELGSRINVKGYLSEVKRLEKEKGPLGIIKLRDDRGDSIILMVWNESILDELKEVSTNTELIITNVRIPKKIKGAELIGFVGDKSKIKIGSNSKRDVNIKPLSLANIGSYETVFGTITEVEFVGEIEYCEKCQYPMFTDSQGKKYCIKGHTEGGKKYFTIILIMDDDAKSARVFLRDRGVRNLLIKMGLSGIEEAKYSENILNMAREILMGTEVAVRGFIGEETTDTDMIIIADFIFEPSPETLINALKHYLKTK